MKEFSRPTKAIIPVAGYGTRRLPITKSIEKCMLPLLNRPLIDYIVQECISTGITEILFVINGDAPQLKSYYQINQELEDYLKQRDDEEKLALIKSQEGIKFTYVDQSFDLGEKYGTTAALATCSNLMHPDENVLVVMGDQVLYREDGGSDIAELIAAIEAEQTNAGMIAVEVSNEIVQNYGIVALTEEGNFDYIVEHPTPSEAPSNLNNASIYVFPGSFWEYVNNDMSRPHTGEYMLIDVINEFVNSGNTITVNKAKGKYLDCGSLESWVEANNYLLNQSTSTKLK